MAKNNKKTAAQASDNTSLPTPPAQDQTPPPQKAPEQVAPGAQPLPQPQVKKPSKDDRLPSRDTMIAEAQAQGYMLYKGDTFNKLSKEKAHKTDEKVVSENGVKGIVIDTIDGKPSKYAMACLMCGETREVHSQDFFQAVTCLPEKNRECKREFKKLGFEKAPIHRTGKPSKGKGPKKSLQVLEDAKKLGLVDDTKYEELKASIEKEIAAAAASKASSPKALKTEKEKVSEAFIKKFGVGNLKNLEITPSEADEAAKAFEEELNS